MQTYINTNHFKKQLIFNTLFISALILAIWFVSIFFAISYSERQFKNEMNVKVNEISRKLEQTVSSLQSVSLQASLFNWTDDSVHPSHAGHMLIAKAVINELEKLI